MAETYFPFDSGAGANVLENSWAKMARRWLATGVINNYLNMLAIFADNTGMQVKLPSGAAWIEGVYYENDAQMTLPIAAANPTNPRLDSVVIRVDWTANTVAAVVKTGTPAASPVAPALTQNFGVTWEFLVGGVSVAAGAGSITAGNVSDYRTFVTPYPENFILRGLIAARPSATRTAIGVLYHATDNGVVYRNNGSTWDVFGIAGVSAGSIGPTELASSGVVAATYGGPTKTVAFTVDADGRLTNASELTLTFPEGMTVPQSYVYQ